MSQSSFGRRLTTLIRKETHQLLRDKSNLAVGLLLPLLLILLFGYGLSFDLPNGRVAIVMEQRTPQVNTLLSGLQGSTYVVPTEYSSMAAAVQALRHNETDAILRIPPDFARQQSRGNGQLQLITNGAETSVASSIQAYVSGAIATASAIKVDRLGGGQARMGTVSIDQRLWFNESGNSTWFIVPGLVVLILTLIGAFLTGLLIARERERGTLEAIFVTPVRPIELVLAKLAPYMVIGCIDLLVCLLTSHFLFAVPIRGSLIAITLASLLYLVVSLSLGLTISGYAPGQFLASQVALIASFMPAMMLSGFVFDIRNLPVAIQVISQLLPATHFMSLIKALFLAGDDWPQFFKECGILLGYALVLISASCFSLRKKLR